MRKNLKETIEDLEQFNEFEDATVIREAIEFIRTQGLDLHNAQNTLLTQFSIIADKQKKLLSLEDEIKQLKEVNENLMNEL